LGKHPRTTPELSIVLGAIAFGLGLMWFSLTHAIVAAAPALILAGFGAMVFMSSSNTFLLRTMNEAMRGRVMSLFTLSVVGTVPIGSLVMGSLASAAGAPLTLLGGGAICISTALVYAISIAGFNRVRTDVP
jgi:MFS family permease